MRCYALDVIWMALSSLAWGNEPTVPTNNLNTAIDHGLAFLVKDARAWKEKHNCVSCHHASLVVWATREAKERGHAVDEFFLSEYTKWLAEAGDGKTGVKRPDGIPKAFNTKAIYFAHALGASDARDEVSQTGLGRYLKTVREDQLDSGAWAAWPETRQPIFAQTDDLATLLAVLALSPRRALPDESLVAARDRGVQWLLSNKPGDDPQTQVLRILVWQRLGRPMEEVQPVVRQILARQHDDGGFSQTPEMPSDAWGTGQALYALALAGHAADDAAIRKAQKFLIKTQQADGSWPMTSRPIKPGGNGSTSLIPITGAGSSWGVLGLVRSTGVR